jgi:TonB family protein
MGADPARRVFLFNSDLDGGRRYWGLGASVLFALFALGASGEQPRTLTKPPKLIHFVEATYPEHLGLHTETSTVVLSIDIDTDGTPQRVEVARSSGSELDAAALHAAAGFQFEPAEVDGKPASVRILFAYRFTLETRMVPLPPQVNFEGVVMERFSKKPLEGVRVSLRDVETSTTTAHDGSFRFLGVPNGVHRVEIGGGRLITVTTEETMAPNEKTSVVYLVEEKEEGIDEESIVRAPRIRRESTQVAIQTEEARRVPGTQGDTLKVVQNLPGVARSSVGTGDIVVWGSAPKDTRVYLDGVEVPALYHLGALRSTINSDLVRGIELVPGAYGAEHGRGLGGLVRVQTRPLAEEGIHGYVGADALDASGLITAALGSDLRIGVAGRYSYLDRLLSGIVAPDIGDIFPIPSYDDYQLKASMRLREDEEISLLALGSNDRLKRTIDSRDPGAVRSEKTTLDFYRASIHYTRILAGGASFNVTPSIGFDSSERRNEFGRVPADLSLRSLRYGLRSSYRERLFENVTLALGADVLGTRSHVKRSGSITLPPREGDVYVFGQRPGDDINTDDYEAEIVDVAPYAYAELAWGALTVTPGIRLDTFVLDGNRSSPPSGSTPDLGFSRLNLTLDPRISAQYRLMDELSVRVGFGLYHQAPEPEDLSAVFGNPSLGTAQAFHATAGADLRVTETLSIDVVGFYKKLGDLITRSRLPTPMIAEALAQVGVGQSYGAQLLVRKALSSSFFGWASYTLSRSDRQDAPGAPVRLFDFDQTHVLTIVASWEIDRFVLSGRLRYASGFPRTPVIGALYDARDDLFQPLFGAQNSIRLPEFFQLDLRVDCRFDLEPMSLRLYVDLQNVTYRKNPEEIIYSSDYVTKGYITGLPFLAVAGARLEF